MSTASAMRALSYSERNELIAAADNVHDLRPVLRHKIKQRALAAAMRRPRKPSGSA